ncbi:periplasmic protease [Belliella baltica DSM 15883]|uniref:Periplasmic protease n=1 Tax=Belliella baltica (strain DSM 15883 / CIP 108006 / LMG 21964 / BA134) TaxID=866536 RepID=I3Z8Y7_BELBD|nr:S41 family peptidase [Belliella baltica]AFL85705.1 periplasmic protease [Belliella baltica DSM 15883]
MNINLLSRFFVLVFAFIAIISCNPEEENPDPTKVEDAVKEAIVTSMRNWYFWNTELPSNIDVTAYNTNEELLDDIIFKPLDRFSYLTTREAFNAAFTGQASGVHGFGFSLDAQENMFVSFVYDLSPAGQDGWQRGWQVIEINGRPIADYKTSSGGFNFQLGPNEVGVSNTFKMKLPDGTERTTTIQKAAFQTNSVLYKDVIEQEGKKIGYWVYQSFRQTPGLSNPTRSQEVEDSFNYFIGEGINEMIIDLRYNGGGSVEVTEQVLNYLVPSNAASSVMYTNRHNADRSNNNRTVNFKKTGDLNLSKVIFITSRGSASASELLINSLTPYMEVVLVGDNTFGKPVGSFPLGFDSRTLRDNNVEVVPITFAIDNAEGNADYFDGFPADILAPDSPSQNWGSLEEVRFQAALEFIRTGNMGGRILSDYFKPKWNMIDDFKGLEQEFPVY